MGTRPRADIDLERLRAAKPLELVEPSARLEPAGLAGHGPGVGALHFPTPPPLRDLLPLLRRLHERNLGAEFI